MRRLNQGKFLKNRITLGAGGLDQSVFIGSGYIGAYQLILGLSLMNLPLIVGTFLFIKSCADHVIINTYHISLIPKTKIIK